MNDWIRALKQMNRKKKEWCVPKRGSPEYDKAIQIMEKLKK
jgi:hypothetical protein